MVAYIQPLTGGAVAAAAVTSPTQQITSGVAALPDGFNQASQYVDGSAAPQSFGGGQLTNAGAGSNSPVVDTPGAGGATNQPYSEGQGTAAGAAQGIQPSEQDAGTSGTGKQGKR